MVVGSAVIIAVIILIAVCAVRRKRRQRAARAALLNMDPGEGNLPGYAFSETSAGAWKLPSASASLNVGPVAQGGRTRTTSFSSAGNGYGAASPPNAYQTLAESPPLLLRACVWLLH